MITICSRWETSQMPADIEWQLWRQLRGAFRVKRLVFVPVLEEAKGFPIAQYETMEKALASCGGQRFFLEPNGIHPVSLLAMTNKAEDLTLVLGNTACGNTAQLEPGDVTLVINTPQRTQLYGINAAAIALAYWVGQ